MAGRPMVVTLVVPIQPDHGHTYVSTACAHGEHGQCGTMQHDRGESGPPRCKFCPAVCACPVCDHTQAADEPRLIHTTTTNRHVRRPGPPDVPLIG